MFGKNCNRPLRRLKRIYRKPRLYSIIWASKLCSYGV